MKRRACTSLLAATIGAIGATLWSALPASASTATSSVVVPGTSTLTAVSCKVGSGCVTVGVGSTGNQGVALPYPSAYPSGSPVPGTSSLTGISCPGGPTSCVTVGVDNSHGLASASRFGLISSAATVSTSSPIGFNGISCTTWAQCLAVGSSGYTTGAIMPVVNGMPGRLLTVPQTYSLQGVSCVSAVTCVAVGYQVDPALALLPTLSLLNPEHPDMVTTPSNLLPFRGVIVPITNGIPGVPQVLPTTGALFGVTCITASSCVSVGVDHSLTRGVAVSGPATGVGSAVTTTSSAGTLTSVVCRTSTSCVAVGGTPSGQGLALTVAPGGRVGQVLPTGLGYPLSSVSCDGATSCRAVGTIDTPSSHGLIVSLSLPSPASP